MSLVNKKIIEEVFTEWQKQERKTCDDNLVLRDGTKVYVRPFTRSVMLRLENIVQKGRMNLYAK